MPGTTPKYCHAVMGWSSALARTTASEHRWPEIEASAALNALFAACPNLQLDPDATLSFY